VAVVVLAGCDLRGPYYRGTIVEPPTQGGVDDDNWVMVVDLADREVLGASRVIVGFDSDDLTCDEETDAPPKEVAAGRAVRFLRSGDDVDTSSPPAIRGEDVRVECS
jgi:hypothetical protein